MQEHKSGDISDMRKGRGKVTMEGLWELTNALSNGAIPDPLYGILFPNIGGSQPPKFQSETLEIFQSTIIYGASRDHLCDSSAFLL